LEKKDIRKAMRTLIDGYTSEELDNKSKKIVKKVCYLEEFRQANVLATYVGKKGEVNTLPLINLALKAGKKVVVPIVDDKNNELLFSQLRDPSELVLGHFSILEPRKEYLRIRSLTDADIIFVPGLAWDEKGYRIGHGLGFFDKALSVSTSEHTVTVGLAFEFQMLDTIPHTCLDVPVDLIITEERIIIRNDAKRESQIGIMFRNDRGGRL
jgi:5-formyltetrahydrofolate cyclo-ligase